MEKLAYCLHWFKRSYAGQLIYEVFQTLKVTWFVVFFLLLGYYALTQVGQAQDIFSQLNQFHFGVLRSRQLLLATLVLLGFTLIWSQCSWYSARVALRVACIVAVNPLLSRRLQEWTPRFYALMPPLILTKAFRINDTYNLGFWLALFLLLGLMIYFYVRFIFYRNPEAKQKYYQQGMPIRKAFRTNKYVSWFIVSALTLSCILVFILPLFISINPLLRLAGPASIIVFALSFWTLVILFLAFLDYKSELPISLIFLLITVVFTYTNNNHRIRTLEGNMPKREPAEVYFKNWVKARQGQVDSSATYPVFIVSAEGGGIRAAYWTASVLSKLQEDNPNFAEHVFAISGVSGGSLGGVIFDALYADNLKLKAQNKPPVDMLQASRAILKTDFLSPLNTALLFPDMLQKAQPFKLNFTDRARWMEDDWANTYSQVFRDSSNGEVSNALHGPFLNLWQEAKPYQVPALLLNGTRVETGEKAIVSNLEVKNTRFGAIDLLDVINAPLPLKTATLLSARFPLVTPSGTVYSILKDNRGEKETEWGNIVDGGYVDNTGLETAMSIANMIYELKFTAESQVPKNVEVFVLFIKNSDNPVNHEYKPKSALPMQGFYETRGPLNAFYNAWDNGIHSRVQNAENFFKVLAYTNGNAGNATVRGRTVNFELTRDSLNYKNLPLGWFLSDSACAMIDYKLRKQATSSPFKFIQDLL